MKILRFVGCRYRGVGFLMPMVAFAPPPIFVRHCTPMRVVTWDPVDRELAQ